MRKAYVLIEMITVMAILAVIMLACAKPLKTLVSAIPQTSKDFRTNSNMLRMLRQLRKDVEHSNGLLEYTADEKIGGNILLIETGSGIVCYELGDGEVTKTTSRTDEQPSQNSQTWSFPRAKINWNLRNHNGRACAVELTTSIGRMVSGMREKKLRNSYIYFVGSAEKGISQ